MKPTELGLAALLVVGCSVGAPSNSSPSDTTAPTADATAATPGVPSMSPAPNDRPVDSSISPVSRSHPSQEAQQAMDVCQVASIGLDAIAGMGEISAANRATDYVSLSGLEPELATNKPAWIIQFHASVPQPLERETWIDPVCVVIDGSGGVYATGPVILESGKLWTPAPLANPPSLSLPPLAP